jgi:GT2 family glycosyltransferase
MMDGVDFANPSCSIAAVIVSRDRYDGPERTVLVVLKQSTSACGTIFIIDSSVDNDAVQRRFSEFHNTKVIRASVNLGGAGGFGSGILNALASGAEWIWLRMMMATRTKMIRWSVCC